MKNPQSKKRGGMKTARFYILLCIILMHNFMGYAVPTTFISPNQITTSPFSITEAGLYIVTDDVEYTTNNGTAITIDANDVTLDLNNKSLISGASNTTGIELSSTFTNITIKNGALRLFATTGVTIPSDNSTLFFEDLTIIGANGGTGLLFNGTSGSTIRTTGVTIRNCLFANLLNGISATATDDLLLENTQLNRSGSGIVAIDCNAWKLSNVQSSLHTLSSSSRSIDAYSCNCWTIQNSEFRANQSTSASDAVRFSDLLGPKISGAHILENCMICDNQSNNTQNGLSLVETHSCVIKNCSFNGNEGAALASGVIITGSQNHLENCSVNGNIGATGCNAVWLVSSSTACHLKNCYVLNNQSPRSCTGIRLDGGSHIAEQCITAANISLAGTGALLGRGLLIFTGSSTLVKNCIAEANTNNGFEFNGTAGSNLFIGNTSFGHGASNYVGSIPFLTVAATGPYPLAGSFDNRSLANLSFSQP
jgi:hypothetical protein